MWLGGLTRLLLAIVILGMAADYFLFDSRFFTSTEQYIRRAGRDINYEVGRFMERRR